MKSRNWTGKKVVKALLTFLCCGAMLLTDVKGSVFYASPIESTDEPVASYDHPLTLAGDIDTPVGKRGEVMSVQLHIINRSEDNAEEVIISPVVDAKDFPFEIDKANYSIKLNGSDASSSRGNSTLRGRASATVTFNFKVREDVTTGYYAIKYIISYVIASDDSKTVYETPVTSYIFIEGSPEDSSDIQISLQNSPALPPATYGQPVSFDLYLTNYGKADAHDVSITPTLSEDSSKFPFELNLTSYEYRVEEIVKGTNSQPSESDRNVKVSFNWKVRTDVKTGYYPIVFNIKGKDEQNKDFAENQQTVYFYIAGNPEKDKEEEEATTKDTNKSEPRLIVTGYETDKEEIKAGDEFKLTIHIKNTSDRTAVSNIKFTLSSSEDKNDNCFIPMSGSSTMFVQRIGIGETIDLEVDMTAKPTLEAKSYPLTIESEYEDSEVTAYKGVERISIPVTQELRVTTGNVEIMPSSIEVGGQSNIMFSVNNLGKSKIYNVSVEFEGDSITGGETFKGNLDSGATANVDTMVTGIAPTMDEGYITAVVSYENEKGEIFTEKKEIQLFVTEPYIPDMDMGNIPIDDTMMGETEGKGKLAPWMIAVGVGVAAAVVVAIIITVVMIKKQKRKKLEEDVDSDENI